MAAALPASADPTQVDGTVEQLNFPIVCSPTETIYRDRVGWFGSVQQVNHVNKFHIRITYANQAGDTWQYMDTGTIHFGEGFIALSGHSTNVGPGGTGWYGRWVNRGGTETLEGRAQGDIDQAACDALTG